MDFFINFGKVGYYRNLRNEASIFIHAINQCHDVPNITDETCGNLNTVVYQCHQPSL